MEDTDDASPVVVERHGPVALVTLNRPAARNAINLALAIGFAEAIAGAQDARCIVVTGADPAFCAGIDLRNLGTDRLMDIPAYNEVLARSRVPAIAAVNGAAVTGGLELALACDFIVASERAVFADTHVRVGVFPGPVMVDLPRRIGMARAREMSMTGNFVDAETAAAIGLANHVVAHDELLPFTLQLAAAIADADPEMVSGMRECWDLTGEQPVREAYAALRQFRSAGGYNSPTGSDVASRREAVLARSREQRGS